MIFKKVDFFLFCGLLINILIRWLVSRFPYSGYQKPPLYGDYEAHRHWMEITFNLNVKDWYKNGSNNDLLYWGLDYPPLAAYHSFLNGYVANYLNASWVQLNHSRGFEGYKHKIFMRSSVLFIDVLIYFTGSILFWITQSELSRPRIKAICITLFLLYPGLILIDHGHFQYNCISLGLTLWAIVFLIHSRYLLGSISFCLALSYKQISLYHALPFFFYLLGISFNQPSFFSQFKTLFSISVITFVTFATIWFPFIQDWLTFTSVFKRLFPFNRGLYEDKVANIWCSLEVIIKLKKLLSIQTLLKISGSLTLLCILPSNLHLFAKPSLNHLKYSLINTSLIFFLLSFQVHEKSILLVALPVNLLLYDHSLLTFWFHIISTFSLEPLLIKDKILIPYFSCICLFIIIYLAFFRDMGLSITENWNQKLKSLCFVTSMMGCLLLSIAPIFIKPPSKYPDFFQILNSIYSCLHFVLFVLYYHFLQFNQKYEPAILDKDFTLIKKRR